LVLFSLRKKEYNKNKVNKISLPPIGLPVLMEALPLAATVTTDFTEPADFPKSQKLQSKLVYLTSISLQRISQRNNVKIKIPYFNQNIKCYHHCELFVNLAITIISEEFISLLTY
jgi:hypothetical protein